MVQTRTIHDPAFTVQVAMFIKHEVEKGFINTAKLEERSKKLSKAVDENQTKIGDCTPTKVID